MRWTVGLDMAALTTARRVVEGTSFGAYLWHVSKEPIFRVLYFSAIERRDLLWKLVYLAVFMPNMAHRLRSADPMLPNSVTSIHDIIPLYIATIAVQNELDLVRGIRRTSNHPSGDWMLRCLEMV